MHDFFDEGYGAGLMGYDWPLTAMGRFLKCHERKALADGWRAGQRDRAEQKPPQPLTDAERVALNDLPL